MDRNTKMSRINVNHIVVVITCITVVCSVIVVLCYRYHTKKTFDALNDMIDSLTENRFREQTFDESRLSALENKFAHYLLASQVSARNVAEERNKIKELITDISHQTKTPISNILLYSELLHEGSLDQESLKNAAYIHQQAQKLSFLITSLVQLSRLETGMITIQPENGNVRALAEKIYSQYKPIAEQKGLFLNLSENTEKNTVSNPYTAKYDEKWTMEAVGNIMDNAIKYTDTGGITISVKPYELFCCMEISDTGPGIAEEEQAQIFARFYRSPAVSQKQGVGIGLYLAREIIAAENGYIKVKSRPGAGTVFCVYFVK